MEIEGVFKDGYNIFKKSWRNFILATLIAVVGSIFIITAPPLIFGLYYMALKAMRDEEVEVLDVLKGFNYFVTSWVIALVAGILVTVGLMLLIIPGLIIGVLFIYAIPLAIKEEIGGIESLKRSFNFAKENIGFTAVLAILTYIINAIGGSIYLGVVLSLPYTAICTSIAASKLSEGEIAKV